MSDFVESFEAVRKTRGAFLREMLESGDSLKRQVDGLSGALGMTVEQVHEYVAIPTVREMVIKILESIPDGFVTTYGNLAKAVASAPQAVTGTVMSKRVKPEHAAVVLHAPKNGLLVENDDQFVSHYGVKRRSEALPERDVPFDLVDGSLIVRVSPDRVLSAESLRELIF